MGYAPRMFGFFVALAACTPVHEAPTVSDGSLTLDAGPASVGPGESVVFSAQIAARDDRVEALPVWSTDGGKLVADGTSATWEAPWVPGTYTITAAHSQGGGLVAHAEIEVVPREIDLGPYTEVPDLSEPQDVVLLDDAGLLGVFLGDRTAFVASDGAIVQVRPSTAPPAGVFVADNWHVAIGLPGAGVGLLGAQYFAGPAGLARVADAGTDSPSHLAIHPAGWLVATSSGADVTVRDMRGGHVVDTWTAPGTVTDVAWRPIGGGSVAVTTADRSWLWSPTRAGDPQEMFVGGSNLRWGVEGFYFVVRAGNDVVWYNVGGGKLVIPGSDDPVVGAVSDWFFDDDVIVATASGRIRRIDEATGTEVWAFDAGAPVYALWVDRTNRVRVWSGGRPQNVDWGFGTGLWE